jgi:hypothetical protein
MVMGRNTYSELGLPPPFQRSPMYRYASLYPGILKIKHGWELKELLPASPTNGFPPWVYGPIIAAEV